MLRFRWTCPVVRRDRISLFQATIPLRLPLLRPRFSKCLKLFSVNFTSVIMANSIADNTGLSKKTYIYVPPTPPAELIESTIYIVDFAARKFIHVGVDPTDKFKIAIHIITSSRHVQISSDFLKKIFSYMGHILSFILDIPQKYKRVIFHEDNIFKLSSMVYSGENVLVIEVKNREGCRVLLNRKDLMQLQSLEHSIFETIVRKEVFTAPIIAKQYKEIANYLEKKCYEMDSPPKTYEEMKIFIKNTEVDQAVQSIPKFARHDTILIDAII